MSKLLLIDGYSLLYRAFFSSPPFTTKAGEPTGALYGFVRMVTRLLDEHAPDFAVVAIDAPGGTFRHEADETYKANRSSAPDDLKIQQKLVRELLDGLSIPRYEHVGFEADDVIGTLACKGAQDGQEVVIVTGDGDALQLVQEGVTVLLTRKGVSELDIYNPEAVEKRYGFAPKYVADFKGLKGDTSDNIPGVPGIGDKTASTLLQKYGSLDGIYEQLDEVKPERIQNLLREHREQAFHSREMATIVTDLQIEAEPEDFRYDPIDPDKRKKAADTARRFEFRSLVARYETESPTPAAPKVENKLFEAAFQTSDSPREALDWLARGSKKSRVGLAWSDEGLVLARDGEALFFSGDLNASAPSEQGALDFGDAAENEAPSLKSWLEDASVPKIAHDAKALMRALQGHNIEARGFVADTLLMSYLIEPTRQNHPIDFVAGKFLHYSLPELPSAPKKTKNNESLFSDAAEEERMEGRRAHFAAVAAVLEELEPVLRHEMSEIGHEALFEELELPLVPVLAHMEARGMLIEPNQLRELGEKLGAQAKQLQKEIWEIAGEEFNIGSPKQLQVVLYEKMGLEKGRSTKTGASTDTFTLEKLAEENPIASLILKYRGVVKLQSTYVEALLKLMDDEHRIHSSLNQTGTVSGRISSSDPNLQNVPIRTEQGRVIRSAFISPKDHVILSADYSQIELRILAHITGDAPLVDAFASGEDVHARTAAALFGVEAGAVDKEQRRLAKMTNYAIAYGVSGFGLARQLGGGTNAGEAKEFIDRYFETLPGVKKYIDDTLEFAKKQGFVQTLMNRKRPLPEIRSNRFQERSAAERTAINHPIQGTAADMMKLAMIAIEREMRERNLRARLTMQVHDELVFEVPNDEIEAVSELVCRLMTEVPAQRLNLKVPLVADVGTGRDWNSTKSDNGSAGEPEIALNEGEILTE